MMLSKIEYWLLCRNIQKSLGTHKTYTKGIKRILVRARSRY